MQTHGGNVFIHVGVSQRCRAPDIEPTPATLHAEGKYTKRSSGAMEEGSGQVQNTSTHRSLISVHVGVGERCPAGDGKPAAPL